MAFGTPKAKGTIISKPTDDTSCKGIRHGKGPVVANIRLHACLVISLAAFLSACKKDKPAPAVVEETPMEVAPTNTDTSAVMQEEPALSQVGGAKSKKSQRAMTEAPAGIVQDGRFVVQISVFKSARKAGGLVEKLAASGYPAYVAEVQDPTPELSGTYHRVRVGTFRTLQDARQFGDNTVKPLGYDFWVDKKSMDHVGVRDGGSSNYSAPASESKSSFSDPVEPSSSSYTPAPSLPEPPAPSQPSAPAVDSWESSSSSTPSSPSAEPVAPSTPAPSAPEPPAPASTSGWGNPSDSATPSAPADTGAPKLDDW